MNILEMTHEDLMKATKEVRDAWDNAMSEELYQISNSIFQQGYKHIQLGFCGCIKLKKDKSGIYYTTGNGKGTGADCGKYYDLKECILSVRECGWYSRDNYTYR